jgi:FkbM family methyltransferase
VDLADLLRPQRLTTVVDVGASPIDGAPPYAAMLRDGKCRVIGFEPQPEALAQLEAAKGPNETYLPHVVGDGAAHMLHICRAPGMTSLLRCDPKVVAQFPAFAEFGRVVRELPVTTRRLDDIPEVDPLDFLKIDVQGSELSVFRGGHARLGAAVAVQTEVSFITLYEGQPPFGEIDLELRGLGFVPHAFAGIKQWMIAPLATDDPYGYIHQLLESDMIYVRDFTKPSAMDDEQLKHLALLAHYCFRSYDLATNCLNELVKRERIVADAVPRYVASIAPHVIRVTSA